MLQWQCGTRTFLWCVVLASATDEEEEEGADDEKQKKHRHTDRDADHSARAQAYSRPIICDTITIQSALLDKKVATCIHFVYFDIENCNVTFENNGAYHLHCRQTRQLPW